MNTERVDDRLCRFPHGDRGHMECRSLIGLAHVACPLGMERVAALRVGFFGLTRLVSLVAWIEMTFEDQVTIGKRPGIDGSRLHQANREPLDGSGGAQFIAASGKDDIIESPACD